MGTPVGGGLVAALVLLVAWSLGQEARPPQPTADLYTHLSVARHLVRGEGFQTDVTYPLSFAWPFARTLPQPLLHRRPGLAMLLVGPVAAAQGDPHRAVAMTRLLMMLMLAALAGLGTGALLRLGEPAAVAPWLLLLGTNPLLGYAVDWGFEELPAGLLLLVLWLRRRAPHWSDGLLMGLLGLLRLELLILPVLWWLLTGTWTRRLLVPLALAVAVLLPWAVRDLVVTGRPFFLVQGQAELVKDTREWPGYSVYRGLAPQPPVQALRTAGTSVLRKGWRGLRFFRTELEGLVPWPVAWGAVLSVLTVLLLRLRGRAGPRQLGAWALLGLSLALLAGLYAFFDHSLRHLLVLVPPLLWETARLLAVAARRVKQPLAAGLLALALAANLLWIFPSPLPGWQFAAREALRLADVTSDRVAALIADPATVPFVLDAASPWYADRAAVWTPGNAAVADSIRTWLESP